MPSIIPIGVATAKIVNNKMPFFSSSFSTKFFVMETPRDIAAAGLWRTRASMMLIVALNSFVSPKAMPSKIECMESAIRSTTLWMLKPEQMPSVALLTMYSSSSVWVTNSEPFGPLLSSSSSRSWLLLPIYKISGSEDVRYWDSTLLSVFVIKKLLCASLFGGVNVLALLTRLTRLSYLRFSLCSTKMCFIAPANLSGFFR